MGKDQRKKMIFFSFFFPFNLLSLHLIVLQVVSLIILSSAASQSVSSHSCFKGSSKGGQEERREIKIGQTQNLAGLSKTVMNSLP